MKEKTDQKLRNQANEYIKQHPGSAWEMMLHAGLFKYRFDRWLAGTGRELDPETANLIRDFIGVPRVKIKEGEPHDFHF